MHMFVAMDTQFTGAKLLNDHSHYDFGIHLYKLCRAPLIFADFVLDFVIAWLPSFSKMALCYTIDKQDEK